MWKRVRQMWLPIALKPLLLLRVQQMRLPIVLKLLLLVLQKQIHRSHFTRCLRQRKMDKRYLG